MTSRLMEQTGIRLASAILILTTIFTGIYFPLTTAQAANDNQPANITNIYGKPVADFDLNVSRNIAGLRQATGEQLAALNNLKAADTSNRMVSRWNDFGGSPDVIYNFTSAALNGTTEEAGRAFINQNAVLFGVTGANNLRVFNQKDALGGHLIRFQQTFGGIDVVNGGIGLVLNKNNQVVMASGPFFRDVNVNTTPTISAEQAKSVVEGKLNAVHSGLLDSLSSIYQTSNELLNQQLGTINNEQPRLGIYPTADGYRLVWKVGKFSTNPFGAYLFVIDANSGEIVSTKDFVEFQQAPQAPLPFTADIYPKYPTITDELKNQSIISDCGGTPCGQERVTLRNFDQQNIVTGINGTLTGTHALVNSLQVGRQPFAQAALGTWHFKQDNPTGFEARTNEQDQFAEPAEHQDEINSFFFVNYLIEYIDYLHVGGDNGKFGSGDFPDDYPNKTVPLPATVHMPNYYLALAASGGTLSDPTDPDLRLKALGMDNAFAVPVSALFESLTGTKTPVVINPTFYGHGYLFNDLALEGSVPYHEGMHSITTPIAGLEGGDEAGAMNEGQADEWAFTITDNPSLGDYVVNAKGYRNLAASRGRNPDSIAYIRSARSTLKYSDFGTLYDSTISGYRPEVHRDGEIFMSTIWDIREMMNRMYPNAATYKRPQPKDGKPLKAITQGTNIFERDFLGAMYVLGTTAPDTYVKSRDAMIVADQMLYPGNSTEAASPGKHQALIEQIFAAHEMGVNALEYSGGRATISTQVTPFAGQQPAPNTPTNITAEPASPTSLKVSWSGVAGATAYEILKRKTDSPNKRLPNGKREYADGDASTTGFRHIAFVNSNQLSYEDKGAVYEVFAPEGLKNLFDSEYVVRAVGVNQSGQVGFSNPSGTTRALMQTQDVTTQIDSAISNINFNNGVMAFDTKLTNARGALSTDKTIYKPIQFEISNISNPTVTVKNADANGNLFNFNQTLAIGATTTAKRFEFNDAAAQLFSFDAKISATTFAGSTTGSGSQSGDGTSNPPAPTVYSIFSETKTGTLAAGDPTATGGASATWGNPTFKGITWQDVEVTTKSDALVLDATLSSTLAADMDFDLLDANGKLIASSATATASEHVSSSVTPNTKYILRVKGFANGAADFTVVSKQLLPNGSPNANAGTQTGASGAASGASTLTGVKVVRFTINPLTKSITAKIL